MNKLTIATRLKFLIALLYAMMLGIGVLGMRGIAASNDTLKSVYEDRTVALAQLSDVLRYNLRNQIAMVSAAGDARPDMAETYLAEMRDNNVGLSKQWAAYTATNLTPDEKTLVNRFLEHQAGFLDGALKPLQAALLAKDAKEIQHLAFEVMPSVYVTSRDDLRALVKLQVDEASKLYAQEAQSYQTTRSLAIGLLLSALVVSSL